MVAIIILNYNDWPTTKEFVEKIVDYEILNRIVVVDNCSTDDSWQNLNIIANEKIDVIKTESNNGYAAGNNYGIRHVRERYPDVNKVIISNPDIIVSDGDINKILHQLDRGYALSTGLIYNYDSKTKKKVLASNFCWKIPTYSDLLGNHFWPIYKLRRCVLKNSIYSNLEDYKFDEIIDTECVPGCFFSITMSALNEIEDFDEETFLFTEETILGWKLKNKKLKSCVIKHAEILHEQSVSINKSIRSEKRKAQFRLDGEVFYLKQYLKCGKFAMNVYRVLFWIAFYQHRFIVRLSKLKNK